MPRSSVDVLIVGAGPVGLTAAAALAQQGLTCRIIDKAPEPSDKSKALVLWSRSLELFDNLGLAETFVNAGLKARGASIYDNGKRLVHLAIHGVESPFGYPLMIPQNVTERLLTEHLAGWGIAIERRVELVSFTDDGNEVVCRLRHANGDEETVVAPWLIGCDGAHSTVRKTLGVPFTGRAEPNDWMLADVHVAGPLPLDEISIFWHEKGIVVFFPIDGRRFRMIADLGATVGSAPPAAPTLAEAQAKADERGPGDLVLSDPIWLAGFRINERKVADYRRGRVLLAGDAAHIHSPAGGQGMNTGMQDAFNLAWKLALAQRGAGQVAPLLDSYSQERSAVGDQVLRGAGRLTTVATLRNPVAQFFRNHLAGLATSFGFVQDKIKNALCELSISYPESPLSASDWPWTAGGAAAGDRLPDAPLTCATTGRAASVFSVLRDAGRGVRHALLLLPTSAEPSGVSPFLAISEEVQR
ncbi:MAG TPA: FAD-dependent monooxygenase, partial [Pirellulales bacterium]